MHENHELNDFWQAEDTIFSFAYSVRCQVEWGQKQRLLIARALHKNSDILFLDEATSSLDANNERLIVNNINNSVRGKTIIVAAHRLSTIMNADRILFIDDGLIMESGNHEERVKLKGRYWKLVKNEM